MRILKLDTSTFFLYYLKCNFSLTRSACLLVGWSIQLSRSHDLFSRDIVLNSLFSRDIVLNSKQSNFILRKPNTKQLKYDPLFITRLVYSGYCKFNFPMTTPHVRLSSVSLLVALSVSYNKNYTSILLFLLK